MLVVIMGMLIFSGLAYVSEKDEEGTMFISMPQVENVNNNKKPGCKGLKPPHILETTRSSAGFLKTHDLTGIFEKIRLLLSAETKVFKILQILKASNIQTYEHQVKLRDIA